MRLATLNIRHGGGTRVSVILQFIRKLNADVLVVTEFRTGSTGSAIQAGLATLGYSFNSRSSSEFRQNSVLIASRHAAAIVDLAAGPQGLEHCLSVVRIGELTLCGCYFPQGERKRPVFGRLAHVVAGWKGLGLVLGDMNTGLPYQDEVRQTFKCVDSLKDLLDGNLVDAWRSRHPGKHEFSWFSTHGNGFRIDHALATPEFNKLISRVEYDHLSRESKITDHSALVVTSDG
jgi:exonuclease III